MQGSLTSSIFELRASNTKLQTQLNVLQLQLAETEAQLQQERSQREVTEERSLEQAKRAAAVNVEVVKTNNILKQQLRVSKSQVKAEEDRLLIARLQAQLNDFRACQQADYTSTQEPAALSLSAWQANEAGDAITGSGSRCITATQPSETEHSRGLQQIWNSMACTPLGVPSPGAVASSLSQASVASSAADLPDQQSGCAAEPFSLPRTEQPQVPSENDPDGTDAETPVRYEQRRSGRTKPRVVYEEPKLRTKLRQGDAFTFGIAESVPRSAMRRKSIMHKHKGNLESPKKNCAAVSVPKQPHNEPKNRTLQS
ncbi:hypothetical protein WJX82_011302 [Trebouxia sp. C0006]